jgi:hypothetical protein
MLMRVAQTFSYSCKFLNWKSEAIYRELDVLVALLVLPLLGRGSDPKLQLLTSL